MADLGRDMGQTQKDAIVHEPLTTYWSALSWGKKLSARWTYWWRKDWFRRESGETNEAL